MTKDAPAEETFRSLVRAVGLMHRLMQPYFGRFGISGSQWGVLRTLYRAEQEGIAGLHLIELGDRLLVRPPSVTGLVDRLQRLGLVVRATAASDLRCKEVRLTTSGRELVARMLEGHPAQIANIMGGLDDSDLHRLNKLLAKMSEHMQRQIDRGEQAGSMPSI